MIKFGNGGRGVSRGVNSVGVHAPVMVRMASPSAGGYHHHHHLGRGDEEGGGGGFGCCFFRCCTCIHLSFLRNLPGFVKVLETLLSGMIQSLLINFGLRYSSTIGSAFEGTLTTSSASFLTSGLLLVCYIVSEKSYRLIRASLFETMFNGICSFFYLSSSVYLAFSTKVFLWPIYVITPGFDVYPAMTAAYTLSGVVGALHGLDAYFSLQDLRGQR